MGYRCSVIAAFANCSLGGATKDGGEWKPAYRNAPRAFNARRMAMLPMK
jgi:hypothetical protein